MPRKLKAEADTGGRDSLVLGLSCQREDMAGCCSAAQKEIWVPVFIAQLRQGQSKKHHQKHHVVLLMQLGISLTRSKQEWKRRTDARKVEELGTSGFLDVGIHSIGMTRGWAYEL